jgi:predicted Zn finger-like uncharacterized protein
MIVTCPSCGKKYHIRDEKIGDSPKRLRCRECSEVFIVHPPKKEKPKPSPDDESSVARAGRLARVLASDMVVYNKEMVERARSEGNLAGALASEIERSWQLWKSRFPEESRDRVDLFREALKDILAQGGNDFDDWQPPE